MNLMRNAEHNDQRHHVNGSPRKLKTRFLRHVAALSTILVYSILTVLKESASGGNTSDWSVLIYLLYVLVLYTFTYAIYPILLTAWVDSKN